MAGGGLEFERASVGVNLRVEFQEAFVNAAQFFRAHVAVVHRREHTLVVGPTQILHGGQQVSVVETGGV